jgi:hypothetical protein
MNRYEASILTGTMVFSFLLSPGIRMSGGGRPEVAVRSFAGRTEGGGYSAPSGGHVDPGRLPSKTRAEVEAAAEKDYLSDFEELINEGCPLEKTSGHCPIRPQDFIIAIVPDPIHTHLALQFDRTIEVIEEAVQDEGYVYDRAIMPWDPNTHPESDDYEERLQANWYEEARHKYPGLIIFRGNSDNPDQALFVLVVSETPTGGVRSEQFNHAIEQIGKITAKDLSKPESWGSTKEVPRGLRIIGPTFSGSLSSLQPLLTCDPLNGYNSCYPLVSIHSGSISSRNELFNFEKWAEQHKSNAHVVSFQESDDVVIERFVAFLTGSHYGTENRNYLAKNIALLSEDESAYGNMVYGNIVDGKPEIDRQDCDGAGRNDFHCVLKLYFPREISQLRTAYQKDVATVSDNDTHAPPRDILRAAPDVPGADDDTIPAYSSKQMPLSQEAVMLGIVSELRKHKSQYILLRATDSMDMVFLVRYLRTEYPAGRVATISGDMLFRREAEDPRLHGVLALSTYSLAPSANHNFKSYENGSVERIFPSSAEIGTINAMQSLLKAWVQDSIQTSQPCRQDDDHRGARCRHELRNYNVLPRPLNLYQYGWPYEYQDRSINHDAAPVHILALGRDDFWPIASLGPYAGEETASTLPRVPDQMFGPPSAVKIPNSWRIMQLVAVAMGLGFAFSLWGSSVFSRTQALAKYAPAEQDSRSAPILIGGLSLILSMLILLWPWIHDAESEKPFVEKLLVCAIVLVFTCTVLDALSRLMLIPRSSPNSRNVWKACSMIVSFFLFVITSLMFAWRVTRHIDDTSAFVLRFASLRATQLTSGLSFIMPLFFFLAVWIWWADQVAAGLTLLDERRPRLPDAMQNHRVSGLSEQVQYRLQYTYQLGWRRALIFWGVLITFIFGFRYLGDSQHPILTLERPNLEKYLWFFLALAIGGVLLTALRLWGIWLATRTLLVSLDSLPLRRGFKRIKGFSWNPIWRLGAGSLEEFQRLYAREREALDCARNTLPIRYDKLEVEMEKTLALSKRARNQRHAFTIGWWRRRRAELQLIGQFSEYQHAVARVAGAALDYLASVWTEQKEELNPTTGKANPVIPEVRACEEFVCLVYISFLMVVLIRIRTLVVAIGGMYVLILVGISQYPFEPRAALQVMMIVLLAFLIFVVGSVFAQIHRDSTLSAITDTNPGELGTDFWLRMASFVALPLFSLLASQFPSINRFVYSWLQPAVEALNR